MVRKFSSILVTGANRGIGLEFIKQLIKQNIPKIIATCRNPDSAKDLNNLASENKNLLILKLDVKNYGYYNEFFELVSKFVGNQGLNLLINNAGIAINTDLENVTAEKMIEVFETNSVSPLLLTKSLLPLLKISSQSSQSTIVVNITSKMGSIKDNQSGSSYAYRASKTALNQINKSLSIDLSKFGIEVVAIHPGWVITDMGGKNALINTEHSVTNMVNVIFNQNELNGKFINYDGNAIEF